MLEVRNLRKYYPLRGGLFRRSAESVRAVDGISFSVNRKEIFALVGMSGCGKTTCGKVLLKLLAPTGGDILFKQENVVSFGKDRLRRFRREMQMIFQDPYESINPRMSVISTIGEPLAVQGLRSRAERRKLVLCALERVGLVPPEEFVHRYPHELSGGQRQRVAIARALVVSPEFLVADEPVSMLDASIRAGIMNLLLELRDGTGLTFVFITHDLASARYLSDRMAIMYLGKIVELGPSEKIIARPLHPYTRALLSAVPRVRQAGEKREVASRGELPSPVHPPAGCRYCRSCPERLDSCRDREPPMNEVEPGRFLACFRNS